MEIKGKIFDKDDNVEIFYELIDKYYPEYEEDNFDQIDEVSKTFVLISNMDSQMHNGGIVQFIDNGSGNYFHETQNAAALINSNILVDILKRASEQFPNNLVPKGWDERRELFDDLCEQYTTYKTFEELSSEEKKIVLENRKKFGDITPLEECSFGEKNSWSDTWEELDRLYYDNYKGIYESLFKYIKENATLID